MTTSAFEPRWNQRPAPGEQTDALRALYARLVPPLQAAARARGYALLAPGSMARDLDLLAVPWTEEACDAAQLVLVVCESLYAELGARVRVEQALPFAKPHGRRCWTIRLDTPDGQSGHPYLDLGVMPPTGEAVKERTRDLLERGAEMALCGVIGMAGFHILATSVRSFRCGEPEGVDAVMGCVGALLLGLAAWHYRKG